MKKYLSKYDSQVCTMMLDDHFCCPVCGLPTYHSTVSPVELEEPIAGVEVMLFEACPICENDTVFDNIAALDATRERFLKRSFYRDDYFLPLLNKSYSVWQHLPILGYHDISKSIIRSKIHHAVHAAWGSHWWLVDELLKNSPNDMHYQSKGTDYYPARADNVSLLHLACLANKEELVRTLIDKQVNLDVSLNKTNDVRGKYCGTPLTIAMTYENYEIVNLLLNAGVDTNYMCDLYFFNDLLAGKCPSVHYARSPLGMAIELKNRNLSNILKEHEAVYHPFEVSYSQILSREEEAWEWALTQKG